MLSKKIMDHRACQVCSESQPRRILCGQVDKQFSHPRYPMQFMIAPSARLRPSPFFDATVAEGMKALTTYNHMLMPTSFGRPEEEYWRLIRDVSMWDVACERQVELKGPDAAELAQILTVRDLTKFSIGQGK